jgi:cobalamin-dependent methionine synthase I
MTGMNVVGDCLEAEKLASSSKIGNGKAVAYLLPFIEASRKPATKEGMENPYGDREGMSMILVKKHVAV